MLLAQANRARNYIAKERFEDARENLLEELDEDSLASAEMYVLSTLYMIDSLPYYNVDSAYQLIREALYTFSYLDERAKSKLKKDGYDSTAYLAQQRYVEQMAFIPVKAENTEQAYIGYLKKFPFALQVDSATNLRNARAFETASAQNTYQSYQVFFTKYPNAIDAPKAIDRYEALLFQHYTKDQKLQSYKNFLTEFPETPYRDSCEQVIYLIETGANNRESLISFLEEYPQSVWNHRVINRLLYLDTEQALTLNDKSYVTKDSLEQAEKYIQIPTLLIPDEDSYGVIDLANNVLFDGFKDVSLSNRCQSELPFILGTVNGVEGVYSSSGVLIAKGQFISFNESANGYLNLANANGDVVLHASGKEEVIVANELSLVEPYVAYLSDGNWGLKSVTNRPMLEARYDSIFNIGQNIVLSRGGKIGIFSPATFIPLLDGGALEFILPYDEVYEFKSGLIHVMDGDFEALLNPDLSFNVPMNDQLIEEIDGGYFIDRGDSTFNSTLSNHWILGLDRNLAWQVVYSSNNVKLTFKNGKTFEFQEAELIGSNGVLVTDKDGRVMMFADSIVRPLNEYENIQALPRLGSSRESAHYVLSFNRRKLPAVLDQRGKKVRTNRFKKVYDLGSDFMLAEEGNSYTLIDNQGKTVIRGLDGAKVLRDGVVSIFSDREFGAYSRRYDVSISRAYDKPLVPLNDSLFVASMGGKYGVIGKQGDVYLPIQFDALETLNDTLLVADVNLTKTIINLKSRKTLVDRISDLKIVKSEAEKEIYIIERNGLFGIFSTRVGLILDPTFTGIDIIGPESKPVYRAEKFIDEADLYILLYYNSAGKLFKKIVLSSEQYDSMICLVDVQ